MITELDAKILMANQRLHEVRRAKDEVLTEYWLNELDILLDTKLDQMKVGAT